jgi:hypothetical protein
VIRAAALLVLVAVALSACQTTQELSGERAKKAKKLVAEKGLSIGRANPDVAVGTTAVLQDRNGTAVVVELRNTGRTAQANVPLSVAVTDAQGKALYRNNLAGLEDSLVSVALLPKGEEAFWVNNQVTAAGKPVKVQAKVGEAKAKVPASIPTFAISGVEIDSDTDGVYAKGTIVNRSKIAQRRLTIFCVARKGGKVVAAGRAIVDALPAAGGKPTKFDVFFIGDPKGAKLTFSAPPTVLE